MRYRRPNIEGGTYFLTVNFANRNSDSLVLKARPFVGMGWWGGQLIGLGYGDVLGFVPQPNLRPTLSATA